MINFTARKQEEAAISITATEARLLGKFMATFRYVSTDTQYAKLAQRLCPGVTDSCGIVSEDVAKGLPDVAAGTQVTLGTKVRMKASPDWHYHTPEAGAVCTVSEIILSMDANEIQLTAVSDGDTQRLSFPNTVTDLSEWIEVL